MPTILSFLSGRQITNASGVPQSGAKLYHYRQNTLTALTVWQNAAGSTPHAQPVECDAGGFVPLVYVDDTFDWKVVITTAAGVTLQTYDNLPKAETEASSLGFAPPLLEWTQVTSSASPVALTVADVGKAYEADTTGGNIEFDLPSAASVGDGKGFWFKKTASANSMVIDPFGTETIDDSATSLTITRQYQVVFIVSNGAEWYAAGAYLDDVVAARLQQAVMDATPGIVSFANKAIMEAGSSTAFVVSPGIQAFHPGHPKFWAMVSAASGTPSLDASYNVTSITDNGVGDLTVTIATDFSGASYGVVCSFGKVSGNSSFLWASNVLDASRAAGSCRLECRQDASGSFDPTSWNIVAFGDQ